MKISTKGRYALRLMLDLAIHAKGTAVPLRDVAERQEISDKYLEQIVTQLARGGLVRSVRGAGGGYLLTREPVDYTVGEILRQLEGKVDIYLPDLKYADDALADTLSAAPDYFPVARLAIREMVRQTGPCVLENGLLKRGVVIRHLVLPGHMDNTRRCIDWVAETFRPGEVLFSLMSQYTPQESAEGSLARHVTRSEYRSAVAYMENCGILDGFTQERTAARAEYTPPFDLTGV